MSDLGLLPHDPEAFFGLADPYDRRDLKRAYGKAIRIYKPETHPAEFQRVRDAYERLEKQLRYGRQQQQHAADLDAWTPLSNPNPSPPTQNTSAEPPHATPSPSAAGDLQPASDLQPVGDLPPPGDSNPTGDLPPVPRPEPAELSLQQLALVDPSAALQKLAEKKRRSAQDYFLAAVLLDATNGKQTARYLGQLIDGLAVFPNDPGLIALATEYLRTEVPDAMAAKLVQFVAKKLSSPLFYMLTESLWLRLATLLPFDQFARLLSDCERKITRSDPRPRSTFYLRLLRTAIWVAPTEWTDQILDDLESQSAANDYGNETDLEFMSEIRRLIQSETGNQDPVRKRLLKAIRLACQSDEVAAMAQITQILADLGRDSSAIQNAFPLNPSIDAQNDDDVWVSVIYKLVYQIESYALDAEEVATDRLVTQTVHLVTDLEQTVGKVVRGFSKSRQRYKLFPLAGWMVGGSVLGMIPILLVTMALGAVGTFLAVFGLIALIAGLFASFFLWLFPKHLQSRLEQSQRRWIVADYTQQWRGRLFRFAQNNHDTMDVLSMRIDTVAARMHKTDMANTVNFFIRQDAGLCIFAAIQKSAR